MSHLDLSFPLARLTVPANTTIFRAEGPRRRAYEDNRLVSCPGIEKELAKR